MKIKSNGSKRTELIIAAAVMFAKALFTLPVIENITSQAVGAFKTEQIIMTVAVLAGVLIFSLLYSLLLTNLAKSTGEGGVLLVLAAAEPLLIATMQSVFQIAAAILTVIWVAVIIKDKTRIAAAVVSVAASAIITFIMPCGVFSYVLLGIIVLAATASGGMLPRIASYAGAALSAAAAYYVCGLSTGDLRLKPEMIRLFNKFGGTESHAVLFDRLGLGYSASMLTETVRKAAFASLPIIAVMIYIIVKTVAYKPDYSEKKEKYAALEKAKTIAVIVLPYAFCVMASMICYGKGGVAGLNFVPIMITAALAATGNRYVAKALNDAAQFAKNHPVAAVIAIIWLASYSFAIVTPNIIFKSAVTFSA